MTKPNCFNYTMQLRRSSTATRENLSRIHQRGISSRPKNLLWTGTNFLAWRYQAVKIWNW